MPDRIDPRDLIPMDVFGETEPFTIDLVYAHAGHAENIFGVAVYDPLARMILHRDMARVVLLTARMLKDRHGWTLILKDGLRTIDAQERLMNTDIVRANPHWLEGPDKLLSSPGKGAHPRGMAIDVSVRGVDMGTSFDEMTAESARSYQGFDAEILNNRKALEAAFEEAAAKLSLPLLLLPSEWWDFRFPASYHEHFAPLREADLPPPLTMSTAPKDDAGWTDHFERLAKDILFSL